MALPRTGDILLQNGFEDENTVLFQQDLNAAPVGVIDAALLDTLFNSPTWNNGVDDGQGAAIVEDGATERGRVMKPYHSTTLSYG